MHPLQQMLQHQLRSLFDAEMQLNVMLPRMIKKSTNARLRNSLLQICGDTKESIQQIQNVCNLLETSPTGVVCKTMQDLIHEAGLATESHQDAAVTDTCLMANARNIVHYEIASFDIACTVACSLGQQDACLLLAKLANRADFHSQLLDRIALGKRSSSRMKKKTAHGAN